MILPPKRVPHGISPSASEPRPTGRAWVRRVLTCSLAGFLTAVAVPALAASASTPPHATGTLIYGHLGTVATAGPVTALVRDSNDNIWALESGSNDLQEFIYDSGSSQWVAQPPISLPGSSIGLAADAAGDVFVAEQNAAVQEIPSGSTSSSTLPTPITVSSTPWQITSDRQGNIWVANQDNKIQELTYDGTSTWSAGSTVDDQQNGSLVSSLAVGDDGTVLVATNGGTHWLEAIPFTNGVAGTPYDPTAPHYVQTSAMIDGRLWIDVVNPNGISTMEATGNPPLWNSTLGTMYGGSWPVSVGTAGRPTAITGGFQGGVWFTDGLSLQGTTYSPTTHLWTVTKYFSTPYNDLRSLAQSSDGSVFVGGYNHSSIDIYGLAPEVDPTFTSADSASFTPGVSSSVTISATGYPQPTFSAAGLPQGFSLVDNFDGTATLSGVASPYSAGSYPVKILARTPNATTTQAFTLTVTGTSPGASIAWIGKNWQGNFFGGTTFNHLVQGTDGSGNPDGSLWGIGQDHVIHRIAVDNTTGAASQTLTGNSNNSVAAGNSPTGILSDGFGNIWVSNSNDGTVQEINYDPATDTATALTPIALSVSHPIELRMDAQKNIWVLDAVDGQLQELTTSDNVTWSPQPPIALSTGTDEAGESLAIDASNNVWVALGWGGKVWEVPAGSTSASTLPAPVNLGGALRVIAADSQGNIYADRANGGNDTLVPLTESNGAPTAGTQLTMPSSNMFALAIPSPGQFITAWGGSGGWIARTDASGSTVTSQWLNPAHYTYGLLIAGSGIWAAEDAGLQRLVTTPVINPVITSSNHLTIQVGQNFYFGVSSTGTPAAAFSAVGLPQGVAFSDYANGQGALTGTPSTVGTYHLYFTVTNSPQTVVVQDFTLTVALHTTAPSFTSSSTSAMFPIGVASSISFTTAESPALSLTSGSLPSGVTFVDNGDGTATLAGTPATGSSGTYVLTIGASNGVSPDASLTFTLTVPRDPVFQSSTSAEFTMGTAGSFTVTTSGLPTASISESGALPDGVTFVDNGDGTATLAGTPSSGAVGTFPLTFTASNGSGTTPTQTFTLTVISADAPSITSTNTATWSVGSSNSKTIETSGTPVAALALTGTLPSGISFRDNHDGTGTLHGTPGSGTAGIYTLTVTASNGTLPNATQTFTLVITAPPSAPRNPVASVRNGVVTVNWTAPSTSNQSAIARYVVTASPSGATCTATTLHCSFSSLPAGTYTFTVAAINGAGTSQGSSPTAPLSFTSVPGAPTGLVATVDGTSVTLTWTPPSNTGGLSLGAYAVVATPGGVKASWNLTTITLTQQPPGVYSYKVFAQNAKGFSVASSAVVVVIGSAPSAPRSVIATASGTSALVSWTEPSASGGLTVSRYHVSVFQGSTLVSSASCSTNGALHCTVNGLHHGSTYSFSVTATNAKGTGPSSARSRRLTIS